MKRESAICAVRPGRKPLAIPELLILSTVVSGYGNHLGAKS